MSDCRSPSLLNWAVFDWNYSIFVDWMSFHDFVLFSSLLTLLLLFFVVCSTAEPAHAQLMMFLNVLIVFVGLKSQTKNQNNREITCFLRKRAWWELHKTLKLKTKETKIWENSKQLKEFCKLYITGMFLWFSLRRKNLSLTPLFNRNYMTLFGHVEDLHFIVNWWNWQ